MKKPSKDNKEFSDAQKRILRWRKEGPARFAVDALGMPEKWDDVKKIGVMPWWWEASAKLVEKKRLSVRSGHGVGKTTFIAISVMWFMVCYFPTKIPCTAPTAHQLSDVLWAEIAKWLRVLETKMPSLAEQFEWTQDEFRLKAAPKESFAVARTARADKPEALQGFHCFVQGTVDVLTRSGWIPLEDVMLDDEILSGNPETKEYLWERPTSFHEFPYIGEIYEHHGRFIDFEVTPNHKFAYQYRQTNKRSSGNTESQKWFVREVKDMHKGKCRIPKVFSLPQDGQDIFHLSGKHYGTAVEKDVSMMEWAKFIGWYMAEGYCRKVGGPVICQSSPVNDVKRVEITRIIDALGFGWTASDTQIYVNSSWLGRFLNDLVPGKSFDKRIPEFVFEQHQSVIRAFLDAFRAGDGTGEFIYYTSSPGMADDLQRLILLSGGYSTINKTERKGSLVVGLQRSGVRNADYFKIREFDWRANEFSVIRPENLKVTTRQCRVNCLTTPSGFFYVRDRKTSKPFWTHNSENLLIVADEASGIPDIVFEVGQGAMSTEGTFAILGANPTRRSGMFYETHHSLRERWATMVVNGEDCPMVSQQFIDDIAFQYGKDSNVYRVRVQGEFPTADDDTVIPIDLCEDAKIREVDGYGETIWGIDVARFGRDRTVLVKRCTNATLEKHKAWMGNDTMQTSGRIYAEWLDTPPEKRPKAVFVDAIGIGAGVADRLMELGMPVTGVNVAEEASVSELYMRLRDELWFKARKWLEKKDCKLVEDETLIAELSLPKYQFTSGGKLKVESKDEMKKRYPQSPDVADAFCLTFSHAIEHRTRGYYEPECFPDS